MNAVGLAELATQAGRAARTVAELDLAPLARALTVIAVGGTKEHFQKSVAPDGTPWHPLAGPRPDGSAKPLLDKGLLQASVTGQVTKSQLVLLASHPGAALHQYGGTVTPKRAKFLAIPLTREAKRIGSPRRNNFPRPLFVFAADEGKRLFLAERTGKGKLTIHYALRKSVTIPARPFVGFSAATLDRIARVVGDRFQESVTLAVSPVR